MGQTIFPEQLYTVPEVAEITNALYHNVLRWIKSGKLKAIRKGGMLLVRGSDLLDTLARARAGRIELEAPWDSEIKQLAAK
jgi:excisionase family DNA binding protein